MTTFLTLTAALLLAPLAASAAEQKPADRDALVAGFHQPPDSARPHCFWIRMNGNITPEGITADLEALAKGGIGGGLIFNLGGWVDPWRGRKGTHGAQRDQPLDRQ